MVQDFEACLGFVLRWEGGLADDPDDPGGRTNRGITQSTYTVWRTQNGLPDSDVAGMGDDELRAIYRSQYWGPAACDLLPARVDLVAFDTAVNMGVHRAIRFLQQAAGCTVDGIWGSRTQTAVAATDSSVLVSNCCRERESYYRALAAALPRLGKFLPGWLSRLNDLRAQGGLATPGMETPLEALTAGHVAKIPDYGIDPALDVQ